ncbi:hypothetical protein [Brevundimonas sp. FT23028]|uniref:hypothetical protein n=1 Tax=Brevundimonas sp. FT23028 TaxID=3393748 RepID=UPI003B5862DA
MKPRRPARARRDNFLIEHLQRRRLALIARGELEPEPQREVHFHEALRAGRRVRARDYILPAPLYRIEQAFMAHVHAVIARAKASPDGVAML